MTSVSALAFRIVHSHIIACVFLYFGSQLSIAQCLPEWMPGEGYPGLVGYAYAGAAYDDGTGPALVIAGDLTYAGGVPCGNVARWDGQRWSALGTGTNGIVYALAVLNGELIAGGTFTTAGGKAAANIARWDGNSWHAIGMGVNGAVHALTVHRNEIIVGGNFSMADGAAAQSIARWTGANWWPMGSGVAGTVYALQVHNQELYIGGSFLSAGGISARNIVRWNGGTWFHMGGGVSLGSVRAIASYNGILIIGGTFTALVRYLARWDGNNWWPLGTGITNAVDSLTTWNGMLIVGGSNSLKAWDGQSWATIANFNSPQEFVYRFGDELFVGGLFSTSPSGDPAIHLARWNGASWNSVGGGLLGTAFSFGQYQGELLASGSFYFLNGTNPSDIFRWDGSRWMPWDETAPPANDLLEFGEDLVAIGSFTSINGVVMNNVARWNGSQWAPMGGGLRAGVRTAGLRSLVLYQNTLIAGGGFTISAGAPANCVAAWNGETWNELGGGLSGGTVFDCYDMAVFRDELVVGGHFTTAGGVDASMVARWNGANWAPLGSGINGGVHALTVYNDDLYAGGHFTVAGGSSANNIAKWNGNEWSSLHEGVNGWVEALAEHRGELIVAGTFNMAGSIGAHRIAKWDGSVWSAMGSGILQSRVIALESFQGGLFAGGDFIVAGGQPSSVLARWAIPAPDLPGDLDADRDCDLQDLANLLANFGNVEGAEYADGDLDCDADVDLQDLASLLARFGVVLP